MSKENVYSLVRRYLEQEITLGHWNEIAPVTLPPEPQSFPEIPIVPKKAALKKASGLFREVTIPKKVEVNKFREPFSPQGTTKIEKLAELKKYMEGCRSCSLYQSRTKLVFGAGNPEARLMFIGEAPGEDEDLQGEPFVGRAGELLTNIIEKGMKISRREVYIANLLKCRPPNNRNPEREEINSCSQAVRWQIKIIQPKVIIALGGFAAKFLLNTEIGITRLRGKFATLRLDNREIPVMPTYHPSFVLREYTQRVRREVWDDVKQVMAYLSSQN